MKIERLSEKQLAAMTWWLPSSESFSKSAIICDGAVRSGKTVCMSLSFVLWATACFNGASFAICGKTVTSLRRNVISPLSSLLTELGFSIQEKISANYAIIGREGRQNRFYFFGGRDESSASLIQGMTLCGVLLDEVALMPESFVKQSLARCSDENARFWFNCNPDSPSHWFYNEWIKDRERKNCLYLHFTMHDNPSLSAAVIRRYETLYTGVFYDRFIKGEWTQPQGLVYPFSREEVTAESPGECERYVISCDYGTVNPFSLGLWGLCGSVWYRTAEFYFDSKREGHQKTDEEYYLCLLNLAGHRKIDCVIIDPSAASFIECVRRHGEFRAIKAKNEVADGIRRTAAALKGGTIKISPSCTDLLREMSYYSWENDSRPRKENDHAMDDMRYFVSTCLDRPQQEPLAFSVDRAGGRAKQSCRTG